MVLFPLWADTCREENKGTSQSEAFKISAKNILYEYDKNLL